MNSIEKRRGFAIRYKDPSQDMTESMACSKMLTAFTKCSDCVGPSGRCLIEKVTRYALFPTKQRVLEARWNARYG